MLIFFQDLNEEFNKTMSEQCNKLVKSYGSRDAQDIQNMGLFTSY